jgi:hypothetical protein
MHLKYIVFCFASWNKCDTSNIIYILNVLLNYIYFISCEVCYMSVCEENKIQNFLIIVAFMLPFLNDHWKLCTAQVGARMGAWGMLHFFIIPHVQTQSITQPCLQVSCNVAAFNASKGSLFPDIYCWGFIIIDNKITLSTDTYKLRWVHFPLCFYTFYRFSI